MKRMFVAAILAISLVLLLSTLAPAMQVYLSDGSILTAQSYWRKDGVVSVKVNRDIILEFGEDEVDLKRTARSAAAAKRRSEAAAMKAEVSDADKKEKPATTPAPAKPGESVAAKPAQSITKPAEPAAKGTQAATQAKPAAPATAAKPAPPPSTKPANPATPSPAPAVAAKPATTTATAAKAPTPGTPPAANAPVVKPPAPAVQPSLPKALPLPPAKPGSSFIISLLAGICIFLIIILASGWRLYAKAGEAGWKSLVPIYNMWVLVQICGKPWWWFLIITFVPGLNVVFILLLSLALAERFGKGALYGIGIFFFPIVFWPLLAFGDATYSTP